MSNNKFSIYDYNLRSGKKITPWDFNKLTYEFVEIKNAKAKLLELGYNMGGGIGFQERNEITLYELNDICGELKEDYKDKKTWRDLIEPNVYNTAKKKWKTAKLYGKKLANAASKIITFCLRKHGKINTDVIQSATLDNVVVCWSKDHISRNYENDKALFKLRFNSIKEGKYENGQPLRSNTNVPIPDEIVHEVIKIWENKHSLERKERLYVDIWNREKKFNPVRTELLHKMAPNHTMNASQPTPMCILEKSLVKKRHKEIEKDALIFYHEAHRKSLKYWDNESRIEDAMMVYWYQKNNSQCIFPPYSDIIIDTLRGFPPDNFDKITSCYKQHVQNLYDAIEDGNVNNQDLNGKQDIYHWRHWQTLVKTNLETLFKNQQKQDEEEDMRKEEIDK